MKYDLVMPRDLFNQGNLLTNYGRLYLELEKHRLEELLEQNVGTESEFIVGMNYQSGATWIANVILYSKDGHEIPLIRNVNSREKFSLYFIDDDEEKEVFTSSGELTQELLDVLGYTNV